MRGVSIWQGGPGLEPTIAADHPRLDESVAVEVADYLAHGTVLVRVSGWRDDVLAPGTGRVGLNISTDGCWIWDASLPYYVAVHRLSPGKDFLDYLRRRSFVPRSPTVAEIAEAHAILQLPAATEKTEEG